MNIELLEDLEEKLATKITALLNEKNRISQELFSTRRVYSELIDQLNSLNYNKTEKNNEVAKLEAKKENFEDKITALLISKNSINQQLFSTRRRYGDVCDQLAKLNQQKVPDDLEK